MVSKRTVKKKGGGPVIKAFIGGVIAKGISKAASKKARDIATDKARTAAGKKAADLKTPSSVATPGSGRTLRSAGPKANVGNIRESAVVAHAENKRSRALTKKMDEIFNILSKYQKKRDSLSGKDKLKFIKENMEKVKNLKASIRDMKKRGIRPEVKVKMIPEGKRTHSEAQMKKLVQKKGKLIPESDRLASERKANVPSHLRAKRGTKSIPPRKRRGGGKIQYRSIGGKVLDGNDIINMIYD